MRKKKRPKGFWQDRINCEIAVRKFLKDFKEVPSYTVFLEDGGIPYRAIQLLGGREEVARMTGLPFKKRDYPDRTHPKKLDKVAKEEITPSRAFEIEAEARKVGLSYADIQKAKTLELVGGVSV